MTEEEEPVPALEAEDEAEQDAADTAEDEEEEYVVEDIRAKRRNPKSGAIEYYIKWENYPESQNTWEPSEHLKCPDLIKKFNERAKERAANKRLKSADSKESQPKRPKRVSNMGASSSSQLVLEEPLLVEDELYHGSTSEPQSSHDGINRPRASNGNKTGTQEPPVPVVTEPPPPKGFARNLPIDKIVGSCTDEKDKLWFFIRWRGLKELELVEANELEEHAPRELCSWYRERLFYTIKMPEVHELPMQTA